MRDLIGRRDGERRQAATGTSEEKRENEEEEERKTNVDRGVKCDAVPLN